MQVENKSHICNKVEAEVVFIDIIKGNVSTMREVIERKWKPLTTTGNEIPLERAEITRKIVTDSQWRAVVKTHLFYITYFMK